ncbi:MAG: peptidylprolyl isomerase [Candidatus Omnitrophota bacterium]|nr:peptidylprolyl isomerase [Candidatus Omnitrophota bacterium]
MRFRLTQENLWLEQYRKMRKSAPYIIISIALLIFVITTEALPVVIDKIVAVVNGEIITQHEMALYLIPVFEEHKKEYTGRRLREKMVEAEEVLLNQLIDDKLILSEAKKKGVGATDEEIDSKLQTVRDRFESEKQFRDALASQNMPLSGLRENFKNEIIKSKLIRKEVGWKVIITPLEVKQYYDAHIDDFKESERAVVFNILIKQDSAGMTDEKAGFLIGKIHGLLEDGGDFKELAIEYSHGPNAKDGGNLGLVKKGQMFEEIDEVIFSLKEGEISGIVKSPLGYHLFKVTEKYRGNVKDFYAVNSEIEELIYKKKIEKSFKKWLKELRKDAYISIK